MECLVIRKALQATGFPHLATCKVFILLQIKASTNVTPAKILISDKGAMLAASSKSLLSL